MLLRRISLVILSEGVLWVTLLLGIWWLVSLVWNGDFHEPGRVGQTVTVYFHDANQLMVGSPAHFMGTDVGYVTAVRPHNGRIKVTMQTYPGGVTLPDGAQFTIQFNSLAGAKTLEILPPPPSWRPSAGRYIIEEPMRLEDVMHTQMVLAEALESSSNNFAQSLGQVKDERRLLENLQAVNTTMRSYEDALAGGVATMERRLLKGHLWEEKTLAYLQEVIIGFQRMEIMSHPAFFKSSASKTVRYMAQGTENTYHTLVKMHDENVLGAYDQKITTANQRVLKVRSRVESALPGVMHGWACFNISLCKFDAVLSGWEKSFQDRLPGPHFHGTRIRLHGLSESSRGWSSPPQKGVKP